MGLVNTDRNTIGRRINFRARELRFLALEQVASGRFRDQIGTHGRTFLAQLRFELIERPSDELRKIELSTPCSDGSGKGAAAAPALAGSIQALYLMALQQANEPMKVIEHKPEYDWD